MDAPCCVWCALLPFQLYLSSFTPDSRRCEWNEWVSESSVWVWVSEKREEEKEAEEKNGLQMRITRVN